MTDDIASAGFPGPKAADALRTIGEVAIALGIRHHVLRYWEEQFPMLRPLKRSGGRRYYRPEDVALLRTIHRLVDQEGYTLRGARLAIESGDKAINGSMVSDMAAVDARTPSPDAISAAALGGVSQTSIIAASETLMRLRQVRRVLSDALAAS